VPAAAQWLIPATSATSKSDILVLNELSLYFVEYSMRLICGILVNPDKTVTPEVAARARSLTISWLRWSYFGDIIEGATVDEILDRCVQAGFDYCFIQAAGHLVKEQWSPKQEESLEFFHSLRRCIETTDFLVAGEVIRNSGAGLLSRWLVVNLALYRSLGSPRFAGEPEGDRFVQTSLNRGLPVFGLDPMTRSLMQDLGPNLTEQPHFLQGLAAQTERSSRGVFPWNFESYDDIIEPPPNWRKPFSVLYSVAAGLKPNMILQTHGYDDDTEVVFFDYSSYALSFRKLLLEEWDGRDYPCFLKFAARKLPLDTNYCLWPGASLEDADSPEMQALWHREIERWGGEENLRLHWSRARKLKYRFLHCNLLTEPEKLLSLIADGRGAVIWWSNAFATVYSALHHTVEEKRAIYESWILALAAKAPRLLLYGSDHSNSSVNGMSAAEYQAEYDKAGGDPLAERRLHRRVIRF
jgi:hypothetical protein